MIKQLLIVGAIALSSAAGAQMAPNGGFENWTDNGLYEEPTGWATLNVMTVFGGPVTTFKSTDAHSGAFSAKLETVLSDIDLDENGTNDTIAGSMFLGTIDFISEEASFGAPFTGRPDTMLAWYKYAPVNGDQFMVQVNLTKWNNGTGMQDIIASGLFLQSVAAPAFTRMAIELEYESTDAPDSMTITILASVENPSPGTALWIDDLSFFTNAELAVPAKTAETPIQLYPNPAKEAVNVVLAKDATIHIYNALGMEVDVLRGNASKTTTIPTAKYDNGVYLLKTDTGLVQRFVVKH